MKQTLLDWSSRPVRPDPAQSTGDPSATSSVAGQIERGFPMLRFRADLEAGFSRYLNRSGGLSRSCLLALGIAAILVAALMDSDLLGVPSALAPFTVALQIGLMLPLIAGGGVLCFFYRSGRVTGMAMVAVFFGVVLCVLVQRAAGAHHDFNVSVEFVGILIVGMFTLSHIRFWTVLPAAGVAIAATALNELLIDAPQPGNVYHLFATALLVILGVASGYFTEYFIRSTWLRGELLSGLSRTDSLTGLLNRGALEKALGVAGAHARRERLDYAIAMIDIDFFGAYNGHYGHQLGDSVLRRIASALNAGVRRPQDVCGRYGGEEFTLLWMAGDAQHFVDLADHMRQTVENARIPHAVSSVGPWVTISIGVCHVSPLDGDVALEAVLNKADRLLFKAKRRGRNQVASGLFRASGHPAATIRKVSPRHSPKTGT